MSNNFRNIARNRNCIFGLSTNSDKMSQEQRKTKVYIVHFDHPLTFEIILKRTQDEAGVAKISGVYSLLNAFFLF